MLIIVRSLAEGIAKSVPASDKHSWKRSDEEMEAAVVSVLSRTQSKYSREVLLD